MCRTDDTYSVNGSGMSHAYVPELFQFHRGRGHPLYIIRTCTSCIATDISFFNVRVYQEHIHCSESTKQTSLIRLVVLNVYESLSTTSLPIASI